MWANNSGGRSATVTFSVTDTPTFAATLYIFQLTNNTTSPTCRSRRCSMDRGPSRNGHERHLARWYTEPSNATLWGVPTQLWPNTGYTIYANNSGVPRR